MSKEITNIPKNFFVKDIFDNNLPEKHEYEQFFWTKETVQQLMNSCLIFDDCCCLTTPSLAHEFHVNNNDQTLLDIDERFNYLPKFKYYDVREPYELDETFQLLILDPPFFYVPIDEFRKAVDIITDKNYNTKILLGFIKRKEKQLMQAFKPYNLKMTNFQLKYASIKPNKWNNFALYSNVDLPSIRRLK